MNAADNRPGWGSASVVLLALIALLLYACRDTVTGVLGMWNQFEAGEFAHGYLVLAISLYMVFAKRRQLALETPCSYAPALFALALGSGLWLVARLVEVQLVQAFAVLVMMIAVIWVITGNRIALKFLLPVAFLMFAIPVWSPLSPLLQQLTADVVYSMVRVAGLPAMRQDYLIILPYGSLSIEEACSGLRYLLAALTLGVLYAWLNYEKTGARLLVVAIAALAAILGNVIRVFVVIYLAYKTRMQHPWVSDHLAFGWWLFGGVILVLLLVDVLFSRRAADTTPAPGQAAVAPVVQECQRTSAYRIVVAVFAAVLVVSGPVVANLVELRNGPGLPHTALFPAGIDGWTGPVATTDSWTPQYHGAIVEKQAYYKDGAAVLLYVGRYAQQQQGSELISDINSIAQAPQWQLPDSRVSPKSVAGLTVLERRMLSQQRQERIVWYWYRVAGVATSNRYLAKLLQVYGLLLNKTDASLVAVAVDVDTTERQARQQLRDFIDTNRPFL